MPAPVYSYLDDLDLKVIQDFCDAFRDRESKMDWTNEEILVDRHLLRVENGELTPLNSLVLMAAHDPALTIPGCRVRVHRSYSFSGTGITVKLFRDRMEIEGPGGFVPPVNEKTIYPARASRNHHLVDALRYPGYV